MTASPNTKQDLSGRCSQLGEATHGGEPPRRPAAPARPAPPHQLGLQLVLAVAVPQTAVPALAPRVQASRRGDTGAVGSAGSDVDHLDASQRLDDTRAVTRAAERPPNTGDIQLNAWTTTMSGFWSAAPRFSVSRSAPPESIYTWIKTKRPDPNSERPPVGQDEEAFGPNRVGRGSRAGPGLAHGLFFKGQWAENGFYRFFIKLFKKEPERNAYTRVCTCLADDAGRSPPILL